MSKIFNKTYSDYKARWLSWKFDKEITINLWWKLDSSELTWWKKIEKFYNLGLKFSDWKIQCKAYTRVILELVLMLLGTGVKTEKIKQLITKFKDNEKENDYFFLEFYIWSTLIWQEVWFYFVKDELLLMSDSEFLEYRLQYNLRSYNIVSLNDIINKIGLFEKLEIVTEHTKIVPWLYSRIEKFFNSVLWDHEWKDLAIHRNKYGTEKVEKGVKIDPQSKLKKIAKMYKLPAESSIWTLKNTFKNSKICLDISWWKTASIKVFVYEHL